jgi:type IV pilus assembly protein PilM
LRQGLLKELYMPETIGLDIGSHSIKLVGLKMTSKRPFLTHAGIKEIPYGIDKENVDTVSEILRTLFSEAGLKTKKVNVTVSGSGVNISRIIVPSMPKAELKEAVRWEVKGRLPFPVETAQIDFHILTEFVEDGAKKLDMIAVACPNHLAERTLSIVKGAGLQPTHLDVGPFALWNALLAWDRFKKEEIVALVDLGAEKTGIHFFKNGILQFSREVTPAGADITRAIMEGIEAEKEPNLLFERAEKIKEEMGMPSETGSEGVGDALRQAKDVNLSKIQFLARPVFEKMAAEIGRSIDYYGNQFNERVNRVLLTGGGANLKNITSYLGGELHYPVEHFNPVKKILFDAKRIDLQVLEQKGSMLTSAVGIALREPKRIELLPAKEPFFPKVSVGKLIPVLTPLIILIVFLWIMIGMNGKELSIKKDLETKKATIANLETLSAKLTLLREKENKVKQELSLFPSSVWVSVPYREILKEVSGIIPENVTLTLLSVQNKEKPLPKGSQTSKPEEGESQKDKGSELHITGLTFGSDVNCLTALAKIIEGLEGSPLFKNVKLVSTEENKSYNQLAAGFEIVCDIVANTQKKEEKR